MFCTKCGKQLEEGILFCPVCGTAQRNDDIPTPKIVTQQLDSTTSKASSKKKRIVLAVIAIILISIGIAVFSGTSGNKVVGTWQEKNTPTVYMILKKDNTGEMSSGGWAVKLTWKYNASTHAIVLDVLGMGSVDATYNPKNDTISRNGVTFVRVTE